MTGHFAKEEPFIGNLLAVKKLVKFAQSNFDNNAQHLSYSAGGERRLNKLFSKLSNFELEMRKAVKSVKKPTEYFWDQPANIKM